MDFDLVDNAVVVSALGKAKEVALRPEDHAMEMAKRLNGPHDGNAADYRWPITALAAGHVAL